MRALVVGSTLLALTCLSTAALAQGAPARGGPSYSSYPTYGDSPRAGVHEHDGFYLRMALGAGYLSDSETVTVGATSIDDSVTGGGLVLELKLGGTLGRGFVLGGGIEGGAFPSPQVKLSDGTAVTGTNSTVDVSMIGPFIDYYFDPSEGLHLQALVGYGVISVSSQNANGTTTSGSSPAGLALSVGFGDEWWVGEQWSIGVLARLQYLSAKNDQSILGVDFTDHNSVIVPGLLATFTFH
jgi:hypothetical protein